MITRQDRPQ